MSGDSIKQSGKQNQEILNCHWPVSPTRYTVHDPGWPVRARVVWEHDGEAWIEGYATRWDATHVHVTIEDERTERHGIWLKPSDVYRRLPPMPYRPDPPNF